MAVPDYPDREKWPRYWAAMRHFGLGLLIAIVVIGVFLLLKPLTPWLADPWRSVVEALVIGACIAVAVRTIGHDR